MKRGAFLLIAFVLTACSTAPHGNLAQYNELMAKRSQMYDEMNECASEPGCIDSDRYSYDIETLAHLSNAASVANPYKGY